MKAVAIEVIRLLTSDLYVCFPTSRPQTALDERPACGEAVRVEFGQPGSYAFLFMYVGISPCCLLSPHLLFVLKLV